MIVYRFASRRYPGNDGLGASLYGGRWNHKGTPVIYAAASRALCALEILANAGELASDYVVIPIDLPDALGDDGDFGRVSFAKLESRTVDDARYRNGLGTSPRQCRPNCSISCAAKRE
jgi:hypothetical protein